MTGKERSLALNYSDRQSTLLLWWKAIFMMPIWGYLVLPLMSPLIGLLGPIAMKAAYVTLLISCVGYFIEDILKRKVRIQDDIISHGFKNRDMTKLLSVGTSYKVNQISPNKMILTFATGKSLTFNLARIRSDDFEKLLRLVEQKYPKATIDPVLHTLVSCRQKARKVLVDDLDNFIVDYNSKNIFRSVWQSFLDVAAPWLRFGPIIVGLAASPLWLMSIQTWLVFTLANRQDLGSIGEELSKTAVTIESIIFALLQKGTEQATTIFTHPFVAIFSTPILIYLAFMALRILFRPNALLINAQGLELTRNIFGSRKAINKISWQKVTGVGLDKDSNGKLQIKFDLKDAKPFKLDFAAVESQNRARLSKALEHFAPTCTIESDLAEAMMPKKDRSYTELWLQSLSTPPERNSLQPLPPGHKLQSDQYLVKKRLAVGGQGTAYIATDSYTGDSVVLKETAVPVFADRAIKELALKRFEKEAQLLGSLSCDQIVGLKDYFFEDHRGYLVLEHIDGKNLRDLVGEGRAISQDLLRDLAGQMCTILDYLHTRNIIHRDFTPDNLILNDSGVLKLIDFNVAQLAQVGTTGTIAGKHAYLPPEQFRGKATLQSDIYAMGATLHFLATGKDPEAIAQSSPIKDGINIAPDLDQLVRDCTAIDLKKRVKSVRDVATALGVTLPDGPKIDDSKVVIDDAADHIISTAPSVMPDDHVIKIDTTLTDKKYLEA